MERGASRWGASCQTPRAGGGFLTTEHIWPAAKLFNPLLAPACQPLFALCCRRLDSARPAAARTCRAREREFEAMSAKVAAAEAAQIRAKDLESAMTALRSQLAAAREELATLQVHRPGRNGHGCWAAFVQAGGKHPRAGCRAALNSSPGVAPPAQPPALSTHQHCQPTGLPLPHCSASRRPRSARQRMRGSRRQRRSASWPALRTTWPA